MEEPENKECERKEDKQETGKQEAECEATAARQMAVAVLQKERTECALWDCVVAYQNYPFRTASGLPFHYELKRGRNGQVNRELLIDRRTESKSLTWSSIRSAFTKVAEEDTIPYINRPKALGDIRGVSYIYPMFFQFGIIEVPEKYRDQMAGNNEQLSMFQE